MNKTFKRHGKKPYFNAYPEYWLSDIVRERRCQEYDFDTDEWSAEIVYEDGSKRLAFVDDEGNLS